MTINNIGHLGRCVADGATMTSSKTKDYTRSVWGGVGTTTVVGDGHERQGGTLSRTVEAAETAEAGTTDGIVCETEGGEVSVCAFLNVAM